MTLTEEPTLKGNVGKRPSVWKRGLKGVLGMIRNLPSIFKVKEKNTRSFQEDIQIIAKTCDLVFWP